MFLLDKFPRKTMMIVGMSVVTTANGLIAAAFLFRVCLAFLFIFRLIIIYYKNYNAVLAVVCVGVGLFIIGFEVGPGYEVIVLRLH